MTDLNPMNYEGIVQAASLAICDSVTEEQIDAALSLLGPTEQPLVMVAMKLLEKGRYLVGTDDPERYRALADYMGARTITLDAATIDHPLVTAIGPGGMPLDITLLLLELPARQ